MSGIPAGAGALLGKRLGKFEILALLALGGTAEIYLARIGGAAGFEKFVVVKCLHDHLADDAEFVKMFLDEARLAAHLDHSNIVQTMELGTHDNRYYMVMEFLAGLSLAMVVRRAGERLSGGRLPVPMSLNILAQACAGLHYAHEKAQNGKPLNIVHRDISPQNLVISFEGVVKVVDFGIAKAEMRETKTRSGTIKGKFAYMSPEQCVATNVDRRTDVFALGVIAHELLTGRRLFKKPSPYETYQAVIECAVDLPSKLNHEIDPALDPVIMKAIAKEKEQRYPTAEAFGDALLGYLHHRGKGSGPGDVARFFDANFSQEIDEHAGRMRELISGREVAGEMGGKWDEEEEERRRNETVDLRGNETGSLSINDADIIPDRSSGSIDDDLGDGRDDEDDEMPAERTRIESNPLEQVQSLNQVVARTGHTPAPQILPGGRNKTPPPSMIPTQIADVDPPRRMPPSQAPLSAGPMPLPAPPTGPVPVPVLMAAQAAPLSIDGKPSSGKFPDLANLPTMIADPDEESKPGGSGPAESQPAADPHARTAMDMQPPSVNGVRVSPLPANARPQSVPPLPQQATQVAPPPANYPPNAGGYPNPQQPPQNYPNPGYPANAGYPAGNTQQPPAQGQQPGQPPQHMSYPVMNPELRHQMASGASVFPSPPRGANMQSAADMASPVGANYGEDVDWAAAAAAPAKALPPWKLAVLFIVAIGLALGLTIIVAQIIRG